MQGFGKGRRRAGFIPYLDDDFIDAEQSSRDKVVAEHSSLGLHPPIPHA